MIPNSDVLSYAGPPWPVGSVLGLSIVSCPDPLAHVKTCNHAYVHDVNNHILNRTLSKLFPQLSQ